MTPPQLTADTPVMQILHPVQIHLIETLRYKAEVAVLQSIDSGSSQFVHGYKPLGFYHGLDGAVAAIVGTNVMNVVFDLGQEAPLLQILNDLFTSLVAVHAFIFAAEFVHVTIVGQNADHFQIVTLTNFEVVGVMSGGDLNSTGSEVFFYIRISYYGNLAVYQRQDQHLADLVCVAGIAGMYSYSGIAQHSLGTGGSYFNIAAAVSIGIAQMPEMASLLLMQSLGVGNRSLALGAPVNDAFAFVDQALVVQTNEYFLYSLGQTFVHGEAGTIPVAGCADLLQLADDTLMVSLFPLPGFLQKAFAAYIFFTNALGCHVLDYLNLGSDAGVVGAGLPQYVIAFHSLPTDQNILQGVVQSVTHVQLTGDVWRRNYNGKGFLGFVYFCMEILIFFPFLIQTTLDLFWIVSGRQVLHDLPPKS